MLSYQDTPEDFVVLSGEFGIVLYGFYARSQELLNEIRGTYEELLKSYLEVTDSLIRISSRIVKEYSDYCNETTYSLIHFTIKYVIYEGNMEVLQAFREELWSLHTSTILYAVFYGRAGVIRALLNGSFGGKWELFEFMTTHAVDGGRIDSLRLLRDGSLGEICPWNKELCRYYARDKPEILALIDSGELD